MKRIAVFCGSSKGFSDDYSRQAAEVGAYFAKNDIGLVYGGGKIGLMGIVANTILENQGEVIGVIPYLLRHEEVAHTKITRMIVTKKMSKRKVKISKLVDGYIAMPGGFGTLDELAELTEKITGNLNYVKDTEPLLSNVHDVRKMLAGLAMSLEC